MPDFFQIVKLYTAAAVVIPPSPTRFFLPPARNYTRMQACPAGFNPGNTRDRWVSFGPQLVATFHGFSYFYQRARSAYADLYVTFCHPFGGTNGNYII